MQKNYNKHPDKIIRTSEREIAIFNIDGQNIDKKVVHEFGEEWLKFNDFSEQTINNISAEYFDIINEKIVNSETYVLDIGCGTGRFTKYLSRRAEFIEAVDPSDAIFAADRLLGSIKNVRLTKASVETLPFDDETFDFVMSIGVLHHIPGTFRAMQDCIKKVKRGGYFYVYLYYNLDNRGWLYRMFFKLSDLIRKVVSRLPDKLKRFVCDVLAVIIYMPLIFWVRFLVFIRLKNIAKKMLLAAYENKSFYVIRNDALDRFGTRLEQRFSEEQVRQMMKNAGLSEIVVSPNTPYYHAVGKKN